MKKYISFMMILAMVLCLLPGAAFAADNVAEINGVGYPSIQAAVAAAKDGEVVVVTKSHEISFTDSDITYIGVSEGLDVYYLIGVMNKQITIDLNSKSIHADMGDKSIVLFSVQNNGNLTIIDSNGAGSVSVESDVETFALIRCADDSSRITVNGGSYLLNKGMAGKGMINSNGPGYVHILDGKFKLGNVDYNEHWIFNVGGQNGGNYVLVSGGTYNYDINHQKWIFEVEMPIGKALKNNGDGTWTVVDAVAWVYEREFSGGWWNHNAGYTSLAEAISKVRASRSKYGLDSGTENVGLVTDCSINKALMVNESFTLVLKNPEDIGAKENTIIWEGNDTDPMFTVAAGKTLTLPDNFTPSRYGYSFMGWYTDEARTIAYDLAANGYKVTSGTSLYAKWVPGIYTVTWKIDDVTVDTDTQTYGTANLTLPADNPTKASTNDYTYTFVGWFTKDGQQAVAGMPFPGEDTTYYARFEAKAVPHSSDYSITYNGGNSFSTNKSAVPTSVEIDGQEVGFVGDGRNFTVNCIPADASRITVRWNTTSITVNFKPDATVQCTEVEIPKTGDMPLWAAVAAIFGF